jgi:hypothetical protein
VRSRCRPFHLPFTPCHLPPAMRGPQIPLAHDATFHVAGRVHSRLRGVCCGIQGLNGVIALWGLLRSGTARTSCCGSACSAASGPRRTSAAAACTSATSATRHACQHAPACSGTLWHAYPYTLQQREGTAWVASGALHVASPTRRSLHGCIVCRMMHSARTGLSRRAYACAVLLT